MATAAQKLITAEEFRKMPDPSNGSSLELVRGELVTMPPAGFEHGDIQLGIGSLLRGFVRPRKLGRVVVESGLITERNPDTVRGPDISFWSAKRLPLRKRPRGYPTVAADLCVEILSPGDRWKVIRAKLEEYFGRGVRMVWVVNPADRTVTVYRSPSKGTVLHEDETLGGEDVLPGFSCSVAELFE